MDIKKAPKVCRPFRVHVQKTQLNCKTEERESQLIKAEYKKMKQWS